MASHIFNFTKCFRVLTAVALGLMESSVASPALANPSNGVDGSTGRKIVEIVIANSDSIEKILLFSALAKPSKESLRAIRKDLEARVSGVDLPEMRLTGDEIQMNGRRTGIQFMSYDPIKIKFQGRIWQKRSGEPADESYRSFVQFLKNRQSARFRIIVPSVFAYDAWDGARDGFRAGYHGAAATTEFIGKWGGLVAGVITGAASATAGVLGFGPTAGFSGLLIVAGVAAMVGGKTVGELTGKALGKVIAPVAGVAGAVVGAFYGDAVDNNERKDAKVIARQLTTIGNVVVECDEAGVRVKPRSPDGGRSMIEVKRAVAEGEEHKLTIHDQKGSPIDGHKLDHAMQKTIADSFLSCKSKEQAERISSVVNEGIRLSAESLDAPNEKSTKPHGKTVSEYSIPLKLERSQNWAEDS